MKRFMVAMTLMGAVLVLAAGVAWAATVNCQVRVDCEGTEEPDELIGTNKPDFMNAKQDDDLLVGFRGADEMQGDNPQPGIGDIHNAGVLIPPPTATMSSLATAAQTLCSASGAPTISGVVAGTTS